MSNISIATFQCGSKSCKLYGLWQYDYGQVLRIQDLRLPTAVEIHFSLTEKGGTSITRVGTTKDGVTDVVIPDSLLENDDASQDYWIYAYIYLTDETSGSTEYKIAMKVKSRPRPEAIDRPEDQELFREAIAAVNEAADRAENAVNNLNADVSEKVTRPDTAEVGQALVVKEIDEEGKPTVFEAEDIKVPTKTSELENDSGYLTEHQDISGKLDAVKLPEAIDTALAEAKESGAFDGKDGAPGEKGEPGETTYIENPYDDTELKSEIATKITAPANPEVGKVFRIKTVNEDGTFIGEWADGGVANLDVQIAGKSIVQDGVAEIPLANRENVFGVVKTVPYEFWGTGVGANYKNGQLQLYPASEKNIDARQKINVSPISVNNLDYAVKAAMCDGKGSAWSEDEQASARERIGINEWEEIADFTLEEDTIIKIDFDGEFKALYYYIDQEGVGMIGNIFNDVLVIKSGNKYPGYLVKPGDSLPNVFGIYYTTGKFIYKIGSFCNRQKNTTPYEPKVKVWDNSLMEGYGSDHIIGLQTTNTIKAGTRIVIKGVRA
ncbi:hypothetical protein [Eubacterium ramulus]|uniref:hypothetical protein n=1 Tax=Eubacterium ramulus TaxID=39490 RepID=UPI0022DF6481|nr:hypothetical protein [Eubacterium ramulus]